MVSKDDLKGIKGLRAYNTFNRLLIGASLTDFMKDYDTFYKEFNEAEEEGKRKIIQKSISIIDLNEDEILSCIGFYKDSNGITYSKLSLNNLHIEEIRKMIYEVCLACSEIDVFF